MRRAHRLIAVALLFVAVLCSPAGVCMVNGLTATVQAPAPAQAHAHACCQSGPGTFLAASDSACCSETRSGFVGVFRFTLHKHVAAVTPRYDLRPAVLARLLSFHPVEKRTPLVLRI
jgi:hypothetical protein